MSSFYSVPGQAATVQVGTVTTVAPENAATVTNSGTPTAAVLNFNIPRGITGNVAAAGDGTAALPSITFANDVNTGIYRPGPDQLALSTNGAGRLFVDASGNVSVGGNIAGGRSLTQYVRLNGDASANYIQGVSSAGNAKPLVIEADAESSSVQIKTNTANAILFAPGGTEKARITSDGLVGIGTSAPVAGLDVRSTVAIRPNSTGDWTPAISNGINIITDVTTDNNSVGVLALMSDRSDRYATIDCVRGSNSNRIGLAFQTSHDAAPTEKVRITSDGLVGIGDNGPDSTLTVKAATGVTPFKVSGPSSEFAKIDTSGRLLVGASSNYSPPSQNLIAQFNAVNNAAGGIAVNNWSIAGAATGGRISLTRANAVTVGTFTACSASAQYGQIDFWGSDGTKFVEAARITANPDGTPGTDDMPGRLVFSTTADGASSPTERMRINQSGSFWIGQTAGDSPGVGNTTTGSAFASNGIALSVSRSGGRALALNRNTSDGETAIFHREGVQVGSISVTTTATAYNTSSDYRLKENVTPVTDGITRLQQLKPSRFNFIADPTKTVDGFLAHEVQAIVPEAITGEKDEVDEDGNPQYQGIDQSKLVPLLTAALQEAIGEIESLKARVAALETP